MTADKNEAVEEVSGIEKMYNIFIPTSPNPTSGMFIVANAKEVHILDIKIDDAVKLIISGGVITPEKYGIKEDENELVENNEK